MVPPEEYSDAHQHVAATKVRTKSGCLGCRRRRKKCDETKPTCSNCAKWHVCCNWPSFHVIEASSTSARDLFRPRKAGKAEKSSPSASTRSRTSRAAAGSPDVSNDPTTCVERHVSGPVPEATTSLYSKDHGLSWQLLEFFVLEGSKGMSGRVPSEDPFVRLVLQLSQSDKLIWSAVLALSGSRMSVVCALPTVENATLYYYNDTLVQLQAALGHWPPNAGEEVIRLLAASILLCHEESLLGNTRNSLQSHLRAARELVKIAQAHPSKQHYSEIYAVLFEVYTYYSTMVTFQHAASKLDIQANIESLQFYRSLPSYNTFGYIMVAACDVFTMMPYVALFGLLVRNLGEAHRCLEVDLLYRRLVAKILSWQDDDDAPTRALPEVSIKVTLIYQNALLAFLHAAYLYEGTDRSTLEAILKPIVADTLAIYESIKTMPGSVTTFWPMVILGSCLCEQQDKDRLLSHVMDRRLSSGIQARACEALSWMWGRQGEGLFGPVGLERFTKENNTGLCIG